MRPDHRLVVSAAERLPGRDAETDLTFFFLMARQVDHIRPD